MAIDTHALRNDWLRSIGFESGPGVSVQVPKVNGQRVNGRAWTAPAPPLESPCVHRGAKVGKITCATLGSPDVFACPKWPVGGCVLKPSPWIGDQPVHAPGGGSWGQGTYSPWTTDSRQQFHDKIPRLPVCSMCEFRQDPPILEILNPAAEIQIVSAHTMDATYREIGELTAPTLRAYCQAHGYSLRIHTGGFEPGFHPAWSKILFAQKAFAAGAATVVWIDCDAGITNQTKRLETIVEDGPEFTVTTDPWGINTGVWFLTRSPWSDDFLARVWAARNTTNRLWEQDAILGMFLRGELDGHYRLVPPRTFNSIPSRPELPFFHWDPGDFICHSTGANRDNRIPWLRNAIAQSVQIRQTAPESV